MTASKGPTSDSPSGLPRLFDEDGEAGEAPEPTRMTPAGRAVIPPAQARAYIVVVSGPSAGKTFAIKDQVSMVGRGRGSAIRLDDKSLSRHHARLTLQGDRALLEDLGSANGLFVGKDRVPSVVLKDGHKVQLGPNTIIRFNFDEFEASSIASRLTDVRFFDSHKYEEPFYRKREQAFGLSFTFTTDRLAPETVGLARGYGVVCCFVNDTLNRKTLDALKQVGVRMIVLRCAGYNNVDIDYARELGIAVTRVPSYSPTSVAEHALALLLSLNRQIHRSYLKTREHNFSLEGLVGFELRSKTVGVIGTGRIGAIFATIVSALGCKVLGFSPRSRNAQLLGLANFKYVDLDELYAQSDIISLHVPLTGVNRHMIDGDSIAKMKDGVYIINTGRGELIDTEALITGLESGKVGAAALDVYEKESGVFFSDFSELQLQDGVLRKLLTFKNVIVTAHQAFLTTEALDAIAETTCFNIAQFAGGGQLTNAIMNQRAHHRYRYKARVMITDDEDKASGPYETLDLSLGGTMVLGGTDVPHDRELSLTLMLKYGKQEIEATVVMRARVVRVERQGIALRFVGASPEALTHLKRAMLWLDYG